MKTKNIYFIWTAFTLFISLITLVSAQPTDYQQCGFGEMMSSYNSTGFAILGWLIYILVIILIIAGIYWLITYSSKK